MSRIIVASILWASVALAQVHVPGVYVEDIRVQILTDSPYVPGALVDAGWGELPDPKSWSECKGLVPPGAALVIRLRDAVWFIHVGENERHGYPVEGRYTAAVKLDVRHYLYVFMKVPVRTYAHTGFVLTRRVAEDAPRCIGKVHGHYVIEEDNDEAKDSLHP